MSDASSAPTAILTGPPGGDRLPPRRLWGISAAWLAFNFHWMALLQIIIPSQIRAIAPDNKAGAEGLLLGAGAIIGLLVPLFIGAVSDRCLSRWGRRTPFMVAGLIVNVAGLALLWYGGLHRSFNLYVVGFLVVQLGSNTMGGSYNGVIPDMVPKAQWGEASGCMAVASQFGSIAGAFGSGMLMATHHVLLSFIVIAAVMVLFTAITLASMKEQPLDRRLEPLDLAQFFRSLWIDPREYPDFAWVWITRFLVTMGLWCVQPWIQYYLEDVIHVKNPEGMAGNLLGILLIGAGITGYFGGKISDRTGRKPVVYAANGFIALVAVAFCFGHTLTFAFAAGALYGLGYGAYYSVDWALGCDVLPNKEDAAKDMGIWHVSMVLPQSIAPPLSGALLAAFGHTTTAGPSGPVIHYHLAGYQSIFCLAAFFMVLGALFVRNVRGVR